MKTKRIFTVAALLFAASVLTFSCKSDDDGGDGGGAASGTMTAKVDGTTVNTMEMTTSGALVGGALMITGNDGGQNPNKAFTLEIVNFDDVGTYPIGGVGNVFNIASYVETVVNISNPQNSVVKTYSAPYDGGEQVGEIKISEITNTYVKGTFSFKGKNPDDGSIKNITDGSFNVKLMNP